MVEQIILRGEVPDSTCMTIESFEPAGGKTFGEQVNNCISQLLEFMPQDRTSGLCIAQQSFFINAQSQEEYTKRSRIIVDKLSRLPNYRFPATSIVAQVPAGGYQVVLEVIFTRISQAHQVIYKHHEDLPYTVLDQGGTKVVHAGGMMGLANDTIETSCTRAFETALSILHAEGMKVEHIVRQWSYVEHIAAVNDFQAGTQNYQVFNDVRAHFYSRGDFSKGYPAATGIGMNTGGVIIGFIAISPSPDVCIAAIRNPRQTDAHAYSESTLLGKKTGLTAQKSTPKFERAKLVRWKGKTTIFVSGTASIVGELTVGKRKVEVQTQTAIENIYQLFSRENRQMHGMDVDLTDITFSHLRVYVKERRDISAVKAICEERLNFQSILYLQSDVCREDLLVEIEGMLTLP